MKIILLSDTHSYIDDKILSYCNDADEIWHAGDIGKYSIIEQLENIAPVRAVYGNIDDAELRQEFPLDLTFQCEGLKVYMTHIGGYPEKYTKRVRKNLETIQPDIYVCGHSHILKVMRDKKLNLVHMNPGACGIHGFHKIRTIIRFEIINTKIQNLEVIELGLRGALRNGNKI